MTTNTNNTNTIITPYHPPTSPSSIHHVALSSKSFRVFGLNDPAWKNARRDWKKYKKNGESGVAKKSDGGGSGGIVNIAGDDDTNEKSSSGGGGGGGKSMMSGGGKMSSVKGNFDCSDSDSSSDEDGDSEDGDDDSDSEIEEEEELEFICNAITTALADDAGGFGTAGFHVNKADTVQLLSNLDNNNSSPSVFNAKLIPHDAQSKAPLVPSSVLTIDADTGKVKYAENSNDEFYLGGNTNNTIDNGGEELPSSSQSPHFQLRINISKAREGLAAKEYYDALFAKRKEIVDAENDMDLNVDQWVAEDEHLQELQQTLMDARENHKEEDTEEGERAAPILGYYVEFLLVEPHVQMEDIVIAPPSDLDKTNLTAKSISSSRSMSMKSIDEEVVEGSAKDDGSANKKSVFRGDIYTSRQFAVPGPWEKANMKAYTDIGFDVRKALVRVEFPVFPEGCKEKTFREVYQLNARLKSGSFATVCRGTHRATNKKIAVKCVLRKDLPPSDDAAIYDEVLILSTLRHTYICPLIDFFEERECYFLIMELMSGGDLFDRIGKNKSYTENDARDLCRKMLESVRYCHENSVAHCDMKPKNLLLVSDDDDVQMKLADFGFATRVYQPGSLTKQCGTPFFVAPEVLMRTPYDQQSDMWSCGVIMFLLLGGDLPFMGRSQKELFRNIVMGRYEFEENGWANISEEAKDLVRKLLITDPLQRLSSREAMASPWMRQRGNMLAKNNLQYTSQRLKGFNARMKLRASMIAVSSVVSMRSSLRNLQSMKSDRSVASTASSTGPDRRPSFLDLPEEGIEDEGGEEED